MADDDDKEDETENRVIMITNNLPNSDSSLMDLMQVYSDSDENKIYTSFINIGDANIPSSKLINSINKLRGCNINNYVLDNKQSVVEKIKTDFEYIINPIFFNISLIVKGCKTDTIYGYNNNMKKITKLNQTGTVKTIKTLFVNQNEDDNVDKAEVITI